jgi:hypothetical protein
MSVYPVLEVNSLVGRCKQDLEQFKTEVSLATGIDIPVVELVTEPQHDTLKSKIAELVGKMPQGDYVDVISTLDSSAQQQAWMYRTYLVYQILIALTLCLSNEPLFSKVFNDNEPPTESKFNFRSFRSDVTEKNRLANIKLGIFGSLTPTSDIDIGFQYSGESDGYTPCLAYVVSRFEKLFTIFTGKSCLTFDVESYADMVTIPNTNQETSKQYPDLFYLDSSKLSWDESTKTKLLPIAFNSIVRNAMIAGVKPEDISLTSIFAPFDSEISEDVKKLKGDQNVETLLNQSKTTVADFLKLPYEEQVNAYYAKVDAAETLKQSTLANKKTLDDLNTLTPSEIMELMVKIGEALTFRMESYTCSSTVVHVVRLLQAAAKEDVKVAAQKLVTSVSPSSALNAAQKLLTTTKYPTTSPTELCNLGTKLQTPKCTVGKTGFILSELEQLGYMYRFHKKYCEPCKKKVSKYRIRLDHAKSQSVVKTGGRPKKVVSSIRKRKNKQHTTKKVVTKHKKVSVCKRRAYNKCKNTKYKPRQ